LQLYSLLISIERSTVAPNRNIIFVLGGPGSGKGTQCERMIKRFKFVHFSAGDLLREQAKKTDTEIGKMIAKFIEDGKIVPGEVTIELLRQSIMNHPNSENSTFLIDGFPREMKQALDFERAIAPCTFVMFFDCPMEVLEQRLLKRGESSGRSDDNITSIKKRFVTFHQQSMPVIEYFGALNKVEKLDSSKSIDEVFEDVQQLHKKYFEKQE
jgi:UMP-CMP kinase family protein